MKPRLFGDILPFIGFREYRVDWDLIADEELPSDWWGVPVKFFEMEWFGRGVQLFMEIDA